MTGRLGRLHQIWRAIPPAPRRAALRALTLAAAPRADATPPTSSAGAVIAGEMARISGLGEAARLLHAGLASLGADRGAVELGVLRPPIPTTLPEDAALILHVNAPSIPLMLARAEKNFLRGRRVIGFWNWELESLPKNWRRAEQFVHDIWTPSAFTKAAIETIYPGRVRLVPYPLASLDLAPAMPDRASIGLPDHAVIVTVIANLGASFARKNPLGAIAAHRAAFGNRADRILVLKLAGGDAFPGDMGRVRAAIGDAGNIRLIDETWPGEKLRTLLAGTDILLSPHRAEGFGLVPAEAMLRGIAVVATGWSGNLQFMDETSAGLVPYRLIPVADDRGDYDVKGAVWAEPDIDEAASLLLRLADDPARRIELALRGQAYARAALGLDPLESALTANGIG
ncbi:glycosyltransferase family 4 protein [Acidiphilium iwatense]|uniref:Glycosyltransferase family 4 protein n=1 Tax=Acidiphilium iwatense TaxID=768198 RepID=A0ABS9DX02_9PROT|nr:glycosyltransferase family 4 protein [Acidiphilium iwatense]MCF3947271.1 glycosyltransferase family 4 protein [Acidiphilium iwatense]